MNYREFEVFLIELIHKTQLKKTQNSKISYLRQILLNKIYIHTTKRENMWKEMQHTHTQARKIQKKRLCIQKEKISLLILWISSIKKTSNSL
jgi:hypothetical protein